MPDEVDTSDLVVGETYDVTFEDCCIQGEFTSRLVSVDVVEGGYVDRLEFANGVTLIEFGQVRFRTHVPKS